MDFPGGSAVRNPPAMQETWAWSLGREDPLEKETAIHSKILAWEIPWTEEPGGPWVHCVHWVTRVGRTQWLNHHHLFTFSNIKKKTNSCMVFDHLHYTMTDLMTTSIFVSNISLFRLKNSTLMTIHIDSSFTQTHIVSVPNLPFTICDTKKVT